MCKIVGVAANEPGGLLFEMRLLALHVNIFLVLKFQGECQRPVAWKP